MVFPQCIVNLQFFKNSWTELYCMTAEKRTCNDVLLCKHEIFANVRQLLFDKLSLQKRNTGNILLSSLGYSSSLLKYVAHSEQQKNVRAVGVLITNENLFRTGFFDELAFSQGDARLRQNFGFLISCTPLKTTVLTVSDKTQSRYRAIYLLALLMSFYALCRNLGQSLKPSSSLLKEVICTSALKCIYYYRSSLSLQRRNEQGWRPSSKSLSWYSLVASFTDNWFGSGYNYNFFTGVLPSFHCLY